jgi:hypothetical protein
MGSSKSRPLHVAIRLSGLMFASLLACTPTASVIPGGPRGGAGGGGGSSSGGGGGATIPAFDSGPPKPGFDFKVPDGAASVPGLCDNLCKKQVQCPNGGDTTISGTVYAPTPPAFGSPDPIFNATVYVPNAQVQPFVPGVACDNCMNPASGAPLVIATSGADGKFVLKNAPAADAVPLVVQVGRWRRQVVIPRVQPCVDNPLLPELTRLPRTKAEGDIPLMAIATGAVDALECVLRKIGVDNSEFTLPSGNGRVHLYQANGATLGPTTPPAAELTGNLATLKRYDIAILECEGSEMRKPVANKMNAIEYANAGGRLFLTHYSYTWLFDVAPFQGTADWVANSAHPTMNDAALTGIIDQSFPKGMAFAQWLDYVGASAPVPGQIQINVPRHDLNAATPPSQRWIYSAAPATVQHFTFNTPVGAAEANQCGRALFSDFHVNNMPQATPVFPSHCPDQPMTPQEKVIEFMLFDLSSCVQPDKPII